MGSDNGPDILGLFKTLLDQAVNDERLYINDFLFFYFFFFLEKTDTKRKINQVMVLRASKHAYTLSLGSKNLLTAFILLSRRCPLGFH